MQRLFVPFPLTIDVELRDKDIIHQLLRVLRMEKDESIILFDGDDSETIYQIKDISKHAISLRGQERRTPATEPQKQITLHQALPNKLEKIEYIIEKGVEIGILRFCFFRSDFSQKLILSDTKKDRLRTIAEEAVEQCGGLRMPIIEYLSDFPSTEPTGVHLVLDTTGMPRKISEITVSGPITLWVGPEGGWSPKEREKMKENGLVFVRFGERVLRTETAGGVMAFALLHA